VFAPSLAGQTGSPLHIQAKLSYYQVKLHLDTPETRAL